jgi:hypothetical protein
VKLPLLAALLLLSGCTAVQTRVVINAPAANVRAVFFRFGDYPAWNPFIVKVAGPVREGSDVVVTVRPVGKAEITGSTHVTAVADDHVAWTGSLAIPGLFRGHHDFRIEADGPDRTIFTNNERMAGLVIPFFDFKPTAAGFEAMNQALKRQAEALPK